MMIKAKVLDVVESYGDLEEFSEQTIKQIIEFLFLAVA